MLFYNYICAIIKLTIKQILNDMTDTRKKRGAYTPEQKIEAVRLLHENNYNYYKTSAQTKISMSSLHTWEAQYGAEINSSNKVQMIAEKVELNLARIKTNFVEKHYSNLNKLAEAAIKKAIDLVKDETDLNKVNNTIKVISDFMAKVSGEEGDEEKRNNTYNLIQQTVIACNNIEAGNEKI